MSVECRPRSALLGRIPGSMSGSGCYDSSVIVEQLRPSAHWSAVMLVTPASAGADASRKQFFLSGQARFDTH